MTAFLFRTAACLLIAAVVTIAQPLPPTRSVPPASAHAARGVSFEDGTARAGLAAFRYVSGSSEKAYIVEALGSGVARLDLDGDGLLDSYTRRRIDSRGTAPTSSEPCCSATCRAAASRRSVRLPVPH